MAKLTLKSKTLSRQLRRNSNPSEQKLWRHLRARRFSAYKFRRNHPIGPYFLDFYCPEARLSIELDGGQHGHPDQQTHDQTRTEYLTQQGIKELRFWNSHFNRFPTETLDDIYRELQSRSPKKETEIRAASPIPRKTRDTRPE